TVKSTRLTRSGLGPVPQNRLRSGPKHRVQTSARIYARRSASVISARTTTGTNAKFSNLAAASLPWPAITWRSSEQGIGNAEALDQIRNLPDLLLRMGTCISSVRAQAVR